MPSMIGTGCVESEAPIFVLPASPHPTPAREAKTIAIAQQPERSDGAALVFKKHFTTPHNRIFPYLTAILP